MFTLQDLINVGLPAVSTDGNEATADTLFSRELTAAEWQTYLSISDPDQAKQIAARAVAKAIPSWATWTQAEWQTYFVANLADTEADLVTSIAIARIMIKRQNTVINAMAKMLMAIRDQVWPDLPE
jgi:hypothetical protein